MRLAIRLAAVCLPLLATPAFADCAGDIQSAMRSLAQAGPQRIVSTVTTKAGVIETVSEKVPGAMHSRRSEADGAVSEYTLVGDRAWSKTGDEWTELPADTAAGYAAALQADSHKTFENIGDVECLGMDVRTFLLSYRLTYREGDATVKAAMGLGSEDGLPRVLQTWSTIGGDKSTATSRFTYDQTITVVAPD